MKKVFVHVILTLYTALSTGWLATAGHGASRDVSSSSVTVNEAGRIGTSLPGDFVGLSYEASDLAKSFNTTGNLVVVNLGMLW
jgi:hypothetical protein